MQSNTYDEHSYLLDLILRQKLQAILNHGHIDQWKQHLRPLVGNGTESCRKTIGENDGLGAVRLGGAGLYHRGRGRAAHSVDEFK